ncbi:hypothetical protein LTR37_001626 [Vermiconidia calcicola]|uniref:Uncharacterized protein n=1 Tax=Vermiconidia calcicola TaxID=1690605 RepID=A0ACC3NWR4_9PEZI|nr:hypothetical protein LTR37_001626 [Vermiconidia calcicola]
MASASNSVFSIPELAEQILVNLDWHQLFVLQRINKTVLNTVAASKHCQQQMSLESSTECNQIPNTKINPLLLEGKKVPDPAFSVSSGVAYTSSKQGDYHSEAYAANKVAIWVANAIGLARTYRVRCSAAMESDSWRTMRIHSALRPTVTYLCGLDKPRFARFGPIATLGDVQEWALRKLEKVKSAEEEQWFDGDTLL